MNRLSENAWENTLTINSPKLSHIVLRVRSLDESEKFQKTILGFRVTGKIENKMVFFPSYKSSSHQLALTPIAVGAQGPDPSALGLTLPCRVASREDPGTRIISSTPHKQWGLNCGNRKSRFIDRSLFFRS